MTRQSVDDAARRRHDLAWAMLDSAVTIGLVLVAAFTGSVLMGVLGVVWLLLAVRQGRLAVMARRM
jgi:hypothetical protein